jgi:anti-anti-sigma regulatory factor
MYVLPRVLTINNVDSIQKELLLFLEQRVKEGAVGEVILDCAQLEDLDIAGLQLLLSAALTFRDYGCRLGVANVLKSFQELLAFTGAGDILVFNE